MRSEHRAKIYCVFCCMILACIPAFAQSNKKADGIQTSPDTKSHYGSRIQRTMTLLETSTPRRKNKVHILCYGQSVVALSKLHIRLEKDLEKRYPHADIKTQNLAIGGFTSERLCRTAHQDLYPAYPDLVIFHVYWGDTSGDFERIIRNIRSKTTAEILIWTHHRYRDEERRDDTSQASAFRRMLAHKYGCELVEVRDQWNQYLEKNNLQPADLLKDVVHPNAKGVALLQDMVMEHFQYRPCLYSRGWYDMIKDHETARVYLDEDSPIRFPKKPWQEHKFIDTEKKGNPARLRGIIASEKDQVLRMEFTGNRVDLIGMVPGEGMTLGTARILIDGKPVSAHSDAYATTRASSPSGTKTFKDWPALYRVFSGESPVEEEWTLRLTNISRDRTSYKFTAVGSVTGEDGSGSSDAVFVSDHKRIKIYPRDIVLTRHQIKSSTEMKFKVYLMGTDTWKPQPVKDEGQEDRYTVIQGIANKKHTLEIIPNGDGVLPLKSIIIHEPPLK